MQDRLNELISLADRFIQARSLILATTTIEHTNMDRSMDQWISSTCWGIWGRRRSCRRSRGPGGRCRAWRTPRTWAAGPSCRGRGRRTRATATGARTPCTPGSWTTSAATSRSGSSRRSRPPPWSTPPAGARAGNAGRPPLLQTHIHAHARPPARCYVKTKREYILGKKLISNKLKRWGFEPRSYEASWNTLDVSQDVMSTTTTCTPSVKKKPNLVCDRI